MAGSPDVDGAAIRGARRAKGLTQADLAKMVGCYRFTILRIERRHQRASPELIESIAEALEADPAGFYIGRAPAAPHRPAHIGQAIRTARKARGLTQAELAAMVYCCPGTIASLERGTRRTGHELVEAIGEILKIDLSQWRRPRPRARIGQPHLRSWRSVVLQPSGTAQGEDDRGFRGADPWRQSPG